MKKELEIRKVLIIDDDIDICDTLLTILKHLNLEVVAVTNAKEGLQHLRSETFHTVLCDIMMPEMTGLECLAQAQSEGIITPFVFITGYSDTHFILQAVRLGAIDFISKPFQIKELEDILFRSLEIGSLRVKVCHEIQESNPELYVKFQKSEKMISLFRACNNLKRINSSY